MKTTLCCEVLNALAGKTLAVAESLTGGGIGEALTAVPGASAVFKGGIISYTDEVKERLLGVSPEILRSYGAVSEPTAAAMAKGVRELIRADVAVSVTGLAGPGADAYGNPVGTVFIGYADGHTALVRQCLLSGTREEIREQTLEEACRLILKMQ